MRLFSEKVKPTSTNSSLNILCVENFDEIFFGVYEIEINKTKYPVEKIAENNGNPVVAVPVEVAGEKKLYPFVLIRGKFDVVFNENNTDASLDTLVQNTPSPVIEEEPEVIEEHIQVPPMTVDNSKKIREELKRARLQATHQANRIKREKLREAKQEIDKKNQLIDEMVRDARTSLVEEFVNIVDKLKSDITESSDSKFNTITSSIDDRLNTIHNDLSSLVNEDVEKIVQTFREKLDEMVYDIHKKLEPIIENELKTIAVDIVKKTDSIEKNLSKKLSEKVDKSRIDEILSGIDSVNSANVELHDKINKGVNKALSRVGNLDKRVDDLSLEISEEVNNRVKAAEEYIIESYEAKLKELDDKTFAVTEGSRKYFVELINESKASVLEELRKLQNTKPIEYIVESKGKSQKINSDDLLKDVDQKITSKIDNEVTRLRKYIAVYSGGGSVAQQFADGGTVNGDLTIVGAISASQYLGITIPNIDLSQYLPLSGGELSGDLTVHGSISASQYLGLTIPNPDLSQYLPLSGGTISGDLNVTGKLSAEYITFEVLSTAPPYKEGLVYYDSEQRTLTQYSEISGVSLNFGHELWKTVVNKTGSIITDGSVVYLSGAQGSRPKAWLAQADNEDHSAHTIGVATHNIGINQEGYVTIAGDVHNIDLSMYNDGDLLYVSPTVPGGLTNVRPQAPLHAVKVGMVTRNQNNGTLSIDIQNGLELHELHDVLIANLQNGQILEYDSLSGVWRNTTLLYSSLSGLPTLGTAASKDIEYFALSGHTHAYLPLSGGTITDGLSVTGNLAVDTNTLFVDAANNRVGVGTASPNYTLDVNGTFNSTGNATFLGTANITGSLTVDTNTFFVDSVNNRVGIGTNTPNTTLTVVGQISAISTATNATPFIIKSISGQSVSSLIIQDASGSAVFNVGPSGNVSTGGRIGIVNGTVSSPSINFNQSPTTGMYLVTTNTLAFATSGINAMTISPTQNVGFGTTSPNEKLTIVGNISATGSNSVGYTETSVNYTATNNDYTINATQPITITLPTAIGIRGRLYVIKNTSIGSVAVSAYQTQTIDGDNMLYINNQWESITIQSTNSNWIII